ncbi:MAG TPA: CPBP family intramembrane glutamic endopeptidase [Actinomycetota bacterium]|nr:CPBP family intramembrane glutamic endopeptidase [Actinomycetota bacterium]
MIPQPPPGVEPPAAPGAPPPPPALPHRPDGDLAILGSGPKGLPAVDWSFAKALLVAFVTNIALGQFLAAGITMLALGVTSTDEAGGGVLVYVSVVADLVWLAGMLVWLSTWHRDWRGRVGVTFGARGLRDASFGLIGGLVLYPVIAFVVGIPLTILFKTLSGQEATTPEQLPSDLSPTAVVVSVILAIVIAPVVEELFFRGILFRSVRDRRGFWIGALVSGLLFGVVHYVPAPWQDTLLLQSIMVFTGLGLAWIYERRGNLVANIVAHMAFNAVGVILIFTAR